MVFIQGKGDSQNEVPIVQNCCEKFSDEEVDRTKDASFCRFPQI